MFKRLINSTLIITSVLFAFQLNAQNINLNQEPKSQIRFSVTSALFNKLEIKNTGESLLASSPGLGGEVMISYSKPLLPGFRINGGIGMSMVPYNYSYHFLVPPGSVFFTGSNMPNYFTTHGLNPHHTQALYLFTLSIQKTFHLSRNKSWQISCEPGIKLNIKESFPYSLTSKSFTLISDNSTVQYFGYEFESTGKANFVSYVFKAGVLKYNARNNSFHGNLVYQYSPRIIGTGTYTIL